MANDKKFIVKNGLQTNEDVLIGTSTDDGVSRLQVDGATKISGSFPSYPTVKVINTSGTTGSPIISFEGGSGSLEVQNISTNDFGIFNSTNGIEFHNGNDGLVFKQNGNARLTIENGNTSFTGLSTTNIEGRRIITTDDESRNGGSFDAATLDSLDSTQFVRSDQDDTMDGSYIITGNLTIHGVTTSINSEVVTIADNILQLNSNVTGTPSEDSGIEVVRGTSDNVQLKWIESSDWWSVGTYSFESDELRSTNNSDLSIRAAGSSAANVNITGGFGTSYIGLKSVFTGSEGYGEVLYGNTAKLRATSGGVEATENAVVKGDITVGDNAGAAQIFFDGVGLNSTLYSNNGEIGFLKQNFNYGAYLNSDEDWVVSGNNYADQIISENDVEAYNDIIANNDINATNGDITADAGNIAATAGNVTAGNSITAENNITATTGNVDATAGNVTAGNNVSAGNDVTAANDVTATAGDVTAGQDVVAGRDLTVGRDATIAEDLTANNATITNDLTADDIISQTINANSAIIGDITANNIVADQDIRSGRFVDNDDDQYFGDFNQTSQMNRIDIDDYIRHRGDTDTFLGFDGADQITMRTGGTERVNIDNNSADFTVGVYAPTFYDSDDSNYFVNPAGSSIMSNIFIDDYIYHAQAVTDFMGFSAANNWRVTLGNTMRFNVTNAITQSFNDVRAPRYLGPSGTTYFLDIDATGQNTSLALQGNIQLGNVGDNDRYNDNTGNGGITFSAYGGQSATSNPSMQISGNNGGWSLVYLNRIDIGNNPFSDNNRYIDFAADGSSVQTIRGDGGGNLNFIPATDTSAYKFWNSSADNLLTINGNGDVVVGGESATYASGDFTPVVGSKTNSKLHVAGGIQLNGDNDAIVFGRGTATFLKDEELGFGWGGGLYMTDGTYLRIRGNKAVYSTGDYYGSRYYAQADTNYYVDPDGDSQLNTIDIDDYIRHRGDVNTYMGFENADQIRFYTNGTMRLNIDNNSVDSSVFVYAPRYVDSNNNAYYGDFASTSIMNRIDLDDYVRHNGDTNTYIGFPAADTFRIWTGGTQRVNVDNDSVDFSVADYGTSAYRNIYYDRQNTAFYVDPNAQSHLNTLRLRKTGAPGDDFNALWIDNGTGTGDIDTPESWINFQFQDSNANFTPQVRIGATTGLNDGTSSDNLDKEGSGNFIVQTATGSGGAGAGTLATRFYVNYRGDVYAQRSMRSPIYYDQDNDNFYGNFAGQSRMSTIQLDDGVVLRSPNGTYGSFAIDGQARGGWEGFSIGDRSVFMHDNANRTGLFNDVDDQWFLYADRQNSVRLMYNGGEQFRTDNGFAIAGNQMRSPIFYDSNNTSYYGDFASTSIMNVVRVNRLQIDGSTYYIDTASGDYGSIRVEGAKNGWAGYAIRDDWVFMSNGPSEVGIYNDTNNEWALRAVQNDRLYLYFNGRSEAETRNGYFDMTRQARAPIYYDRDNTGYYLNPASGNTSTSFRTNGIIDRVGFQTSGDGNNNRLLRAQDYSHWIWQTATNWGIFWAGNTNPYRSYFSTSNPNELVFIGGGNLRASIDLDNGNAYFDGELSARQIAYNGGNESLTLSPAYGTGYADDVLFDATHYFDKRVINSLAPNENSFTNSTSEYVRATTGPFAGSYVLQTSAYRDFYSTFIPVEPGEELYGEISVRRISGSGGILYYGIERYDQNKNPIAGNSGTTYFVVSGSNDTSTSWSTKRGYTTLPSNVYYVRIRILMNYSGGGALRQFGGVMLKRSNTQGRLRTGGDVYVDGNTYANRYYDRNNTSYYIDPASTSYTNDFRANIFYDRSNTTYRMNPASGGITDNRFARMTVSDGSRGLITWSDEYHGLIMRGYPNNNSTGYTASDYMSFFEYGGRFNFYEKNPSRLRYLAGINTDFMDHYSDMRAPIFYDRNNTGYYVDPASTSRMNYLRLSSSNSYLKIGSNSTPTTTWDTNRPQIEIGNGHAYPHFTLYSYGNNTTHGGVISFRSRLGSSGFRRWNIGTANYNPDSIQIGYFDNQNNPHYGVGVNGWSYDSYARLVIRTGYTEARGSMRSPIFYDLNNTGYYANPASTSRFNVNRVNEIEYWSGGQAHFYTSSGNLRGYIGAREENDAHLIIATSGGEDISFRDGGMSGQWNQIIRGDGDVLVNRNMYAQRYYDRNNSGYYGDFASTSSLATLLVDRINMRDRGDWITFYGDDSTYHAIASRNNAGSTADDLRINTYGNIWINLDSNNNNSSSADFRIGRHGAATGSIQNLGLFDVYGDALYVYTAYSFRSPIYYDSNNTGYYINAASTSRVNTLLTNRLYTGYDSSTDDYLDYPTGDYGGVQINGGGKNGWEGYSINGRYVFMSADNNQVGIYNDIDNEWMLYAARNSHLYLYHNGRWEARTDSGYFRAERQMRAPIYYDLNNTGYYLDPASTSNLNVVNFRGKSIYTGRTNDSGGSWAYAASGSRLREYLQNTAIEFHSGNDAPVTMYFRSGVNAPSDFGYITFDPDYNNSGENAAMVIGTENDGTGSSDFIRLQGRVVVDSNLISSDSTTMMTWQYRGGTYGRFNTDYLDHISDMRSPIFYDRNNTGYYGNFASTSRFNSIDINQGYTRGWWRNYDSGEGLYNQATGQHWYSDNDDYWNVAGGSGANAIRFRDEYAGTIRGYVYANNSNQIGFLNQSGSWRLRLVSGDWTEVLGSSIRANIFYDRNNTAYYFNGASTNSTRFLGVNNRTMAYMALPGHTRDSGEYYRARPRQTSDTNYWTGAMGWGRQDMTNTVADWGSGFIDSWSNPANQPSGTSHWVGVQAYHYSRGSARYGWQMVGGPIGNLRFRNTWSSFSSWKTVPILDVNSSNGGSMYAGRYYDSNNTGYYTDPASTSIMNQVRAYVFDFNGTGGDSGRGIGSYPYELFQRSGSWSYPYPALRINYHTGIDFGANPSYQGYRFMNDYNSNTVRFQINGGSSYTYKYTWMYTNTSGFYSGTNGAHFYPNTSTSYGSWNVLGNRNGWYGLAFSQADSDPHLMFNQRGNGAGGLYWQGSGRWAIYYYHNNNCLGVAGSGTSSTYELYVSGDIYATGNIVAYSDRRRKRNIETIEGALDKVLQLRGVTYNKLVTPNDELKEDEIADYLSEDGEKIKNTEIGVIAQEVEEVLPEVVTYASDVDEYSVNYGNMAGLFIEAIKDQQSIINRQQEQIDQLQDQVRHLMERL